MISTAAALTVLFGQTRGWRACVRKQERFITCKKRSNSIKSETIGLRTKENGKMALNKKPVTGMKDILPAEMQLRDYCINVIKETYGKFGFTSIETPCVESIGNLNSKQGGENEKLILKF